MKIKEIMTVTATLLLVCLFIFGMTESQAADSDTTELPPLSARVLIMRTGENAQLDPEGILGEEDVPSGFSLISNDTDVVSVDDTGLLIANSAGYAVISCSNSSTSEDICVSVFDEYPTGSRCEITVMTAPDELRAYPVYWQKAGDYADRNEFLERHGCAICSATTVINAFQGGEEWTPDTVINDMEKEVNPEAWDNNYSKTMGHQNPVSLNGITALLAYNDIPCTYVSQIDDYCTEDVRAHLASGQPVIFTRDNRERFHTMVLLGITSNGDVLVCDPGGKKRLYCRPLEDVTDQMFSCKRTPDHFYFSGRATAGGYIKVGE